MVMNKVNELANIWSDVGVSYDATRSRLERTRAHINALLDQMLDGENEMREKLLRNITEFDDQVQKLSAELSVTSPAIDDSLTMLEKENVIRERLGQLKQIKGFRKRERKKLRSKESELCTKLGEPALALSNASTPTENDLEELEQHVAQLEREKAIRSCTLSTLRNSVIAKLNLLGVQPEAKLEIQMVLTRPTWHLEAATKTFLEALCMCLHGQLKQLEEARRRELAALLDQLALFFDRLDIPPEEQDHIRNTNSDLTPATMAALKDKLYNYDQMKRERLQEFINRVKDELLTWKKSAVDQTVSTTTMTVKGIIAKAERHEALWLRSLELEKLAADPARLMNRGGRLLHETKERQRLQIELPRESRRKATPTKSSNVKRALCGTPSGTASRISRLGTSSATLGSSRRGATPASKNTLVAHGGTPVRAGAAAIAAAKSTRQRSLKAQKKSVNSRQLFKGKGADEASTSTAGPVGGLPSMDSFAVSAEKNQTFLGIK
ncbi:hypothetical protein HPB49_013056 [Dermacentor silvarum]|uniref:Uncharacterized protein n=1 Tax=Dermacentor silvarum TaxID=543639 RepID=A0ACB8CXJ6_DERSI|nr:hypothetical protein HPB49_013056 [Dermacentor silvarum]